MDMQEDGESLNPLVHVGLGWSLVICNFINYRGGLQTAALLLYPALGVVFLPLDTNIGA